MGLTTLLRGFKVPIVLLDRHPASHGGGADGAHPALHLRCGRLDASTLPGFPTLDPQSAFFRARLSASNPDLDPASLEAVRLFIPYRGGWSRSAYGYVAYAFVMVYVQRHVELAAELPELRREILACADAGEEDALRAAGMQAENGFFVVLTEQREFPLERSFMRAVS
jgi:hypothetical protein